MNKKEDNEAESIRINVKEYRSFKYVLKIINTFIIRILCFFLFLSFFSAPTVDLMVGIPDGKISEAYLHEAGCYKDTLYVHARNFGGGELFCVGFFGSNFVEFFISLNPFVVFFTLLLYYMTVVVSYLIFIILAFIGSLCNTNKN